jgi:hypothetical protein
LLYGRGKARHDDHSLASYETADSPARRPTRAAAAVFTFVLGNALGLAAAASLTRKPSRDGGNAEQLIRDHMAKASHIARQLPRLRARPGTAAAGYSAAPGSSFEFGLQAILGRLRAQLTVGRAPAGQNARKPPRHGREPLGGPGLAS